MLGYTNIQVTQATNDFGADIIADNIYGQKCVFQCKRVSSSVGVKAVQEVATAKAHYKASVGVILTSSRLTKNAKILVKENNILFYELF